MNTRKEILKYIHENKSATGKKLSEFAGISRQAVNKHLKELIQSGEVVKRGVTRGAVYMPVSVGMQAIPERRWKKLYKITGLEEDKVFDEAVIFLNLKKSLNRNTFDIVHYAFTEMVNNAIEHSESKMCSIEISIGRYDLSFKVRDFGIGIYHSIYEKYGLADEAAAIGELIKGKTTTMREKHTGEGIFFTSKISDVVSFKSHKVNLIFDNLRDDVFVEEPRFLRGSEANFRVSRKTKKMLSSLFRQYAPEEYDYEFNKTRVLVKLFKEDYVSRSEAKRLVSRLDQFKEIVLDFKGVQSFGQGFADEIFRIFKNKHPDITIKMININPALEMMIQHVVDNKTS